MQPAIYGRFERLSNKVHELNSVEWDVAGAQTRTEESAGLSSWIVEPLSRSFAYFTELLVLSGRVRLRLLRALDTEGYCSPQL